MRTASSQEEMEAMSQMTDAEVKQAIERHGLSVFRGHKSKRWTVSRIQEHPMIDAKATATTLTEAVAEVVRRLNSKRRTRMVDLSQVELLVVRFDDGSREPLRELTPTSDGRFIVNNRLYNKDGSGTGSSLEPRITAIHPAEPAADGWVDCRGIKSKRFGHTLLVFDPCEQSVQWFGDNPFGVWLDNCDEFSTSEIDAAYARHCEPKPVLVWDDSLAFLKLAKHYHHEYIVRTGDDNTLWTAEHHTFSSRVGLSRWPTEESAKAACERHARGE